MQLVELAIKDIIAAKDLLVIGQSINQLAQFAQKELIVRQIQMLKHLVTMGSFVLHKQLHYLKEIA